MLRSSLWGTVLLGRALQAVLVSLLVGSLCFALMHSLPGDPAMRIAAGRYGPDAMSLQAAEAVRQELGLEQPLLQQYGRALWQLAQFDLGHSLVTGRPILEELQVQLGHSLWLALASPALFGMACGGSNSSSEDERTCVGTTLTTRVVGPIH